MDLIFKEKKARVLAIDPSGAIRQLFAEVLKEKGFTPFQAVASIKDAVGVLEVEPVDWIIAPVSLDGDINALQLLDLIINQPSLKGIKTTLIVDAEEHRFLSYGFEHGMLNFIEKPFNKTVISEKFDTFFKIFELQNWDPIKTSAHLLMEHLDTKELFAPKAALLKKLLGLYPGDIQYLYELSRCYFKLKKFPATKALLKQIIMLSPDKKEEVEKLSEDLFGSPGALDNGHSEEQKEGAAAEAPVRDNITGLSSCVIVDPDEESKKILQQTIEVLGIPEITCFSDAEEAWKHIDEKGAPALTIFEWKMPKLSGPYFTQRVRSKNPATVLVVASAAVTQEDVPLIKEMGLSAVLSKPLNQADLIKQLIIFFQRHNSPSSATENMESKILQYMENGQVQKALALRYNYEKLPNDSKLQKDWISAQFAFLEEKYELARDLALSSVGSSQSSIAILNFLSKCLIKLNDFENAAKCLEKAQSFSPMNIERLCAIAEVQTELGNLKEAEKAIDSAKKQDEGSSQVKETEAKVATMMGDTGKAKKIMEDLSSLNKVISFMNNKAVSYARSGKIDESFEIYKKTIESIPDKRKDIRTIVNYNLALAYTRINLLDEAEKVVEEVLKLGESKVANKAKSLKIKIAKAKESGKAIELRTEDTYKEAKEANSTSMTEKLYSTLVLAPGDLCCYLLYKDSTPPSEEVTNLTIEAPHFIPRSAIARDATGSADKLMSEDVKS
jgi:CheY-like chemotaxis protein